MSCLGEGVSLFYSKYLENTSKYAFENHWSAYLAISCRITQSKLGLFTYVLDDIQSNLNFDCLGWQGPFVGSEKQFLDDHDKEEIPN